MLPSPAGVQLVDFAEPVGHLPAVEPFVVRCRRTKTVCDHHASTLSHARGHPPGGEEKSVISFVVDHFAVDLGVDVQPATDLHRANCAELVEVGDTPVGADRIGRQQRYSREFTRR
jgi:hypothetical protein